LFKLRKVSYYSDRNSLEVENIKVIFSVQAIQDIEKLLDYRKKALNDPLVFIERLRRGEIQDLPKRRKLPSMPSIDWTNYNLTCTIEDKLEARKSKGNPHGKFSFRG
jgi:hypothetical protein